MGKSKNLIWQKTQALQNPNTPILQYSKPLKEVQSDEKDKFQISEDVCTLLVRRGAVPDNSIGNVRGGKGR